METFQFLGVMIEADAFAYNRKWLLDTRFMVETALEVDAITRDEFIYLMNMIHTAMSKLPYDAKRKCGNCSDNVKAEFHIDSCVDADKIGKLVVEKLRRARVFE